jgi:divalent metal cation (Fe/Co/Zn/Cd) transporter
VGCQSADNDHDALRRRALRLSRFTVGYNAAEGILAIAAALLSGSVALLGFGLDSGLESLSGFIMVWRFRKRMQASEEEEERAEQRAARLVAVTFFVLGAYVLYESLKKLYLREVPNTSLFGMLIAFAAMVTMPILFSLKYRTAKALGSRSLLADSKETLSCFLLSLALLASLSLNWFFGLWQADPVTGLIIFLYLVIEGCEAWKGEEEKEERNESG